MKRIKKLPPSINYILLVLLGLFLGWLFFKSPSEKAQTTADHNHTHSTEWTCSMHPQIKQDAPGKCPICGMDLTPAVHGSKGGSDNPYRHEMTPEAVALSNIRTFRVNVVSAHHEVALSGKVAIDEKKSSSITANFAGRIERLHVDFTGKAIKKGDRLATIYSPELIMAQKELIEAAKIKESNPLLYAAAKDRLKLLKINKAQIAAIESNGKVQTHFDLYADISGIVTEKLVSEGDYVTKGNPMFSLADLSKVWILLDAYESDIAWIKAGDKVNFTVAAVPGKTFSAQVEYIDPTLNPETRTTFIRATTTNPDLSLKPGMFVSAIVSTSPKIEDQVMAIPRTAVLWTGPRSIVYVKVPEAEIPTFEIREVVLGQQMGELFVVEKGLENGEEVVSNGAFAVDASAQLSGRYSMMDRPQTPDRAIPEQFIQQFTQVVEAYFFVTEGFVSSDEKTVRTASQHMKEALSNIADASLNKESQDVWKPLQNSMVQTLGSIIAGKDIHEQRNALEELSNDIIAGVEYFGVNKDKVYKAYCPMAAKDQGAYWLTEKPEIRNPYYGASMLACGEIKRTYNN